MSSSPGFVRSAIDTTPRNDHHASRASNPAGPAARLARLEHTCTALWHVEPLVEPPVRSRLLRQVADVERWITSTTLRLSIDPDVARVDEPQLRRYERRLDELVVAWQGAGSVGDTLARRATA